MLEILANPPGQSKEQYNGYNNTIFWDLLSRICLKFAKFAKVSLAKVSPIKV